MTISISKLSKQMGKSDTFLNVFRNQNNLPKDTSPLELKRLYDEKVKSSFEIRERLQEIGYELDDNKGLASFGRYLKSKGIIKHEYSVYDMFKRCYGSHDQIRGNRFTNKHKDVIDAYKEFTCKTYQSS